MRVCDFSLELDLFSNVSRHCTQLMMAGRWRSRGQWQTIEDFRVSQREYIIVSLEYCELIDAGIIDNREIYKYNII